MKRREFVVLGAAALAAPLAARAQPPFKPARVGFLYLGSRASAIETGRYAAFLEGMRELGYVEGKNLIIEARFGDGKSEQLRGLAAELVRLKPDVIVVTGTAASNAAKQATSSIPVVLTLAVDPVGDGFAASLARPGGNITGLSLMTPDLVRKHMELLRTAMPKLSRVGVLTNSTNLAHPPLIKVAEEVASGSGIRILVADGRTPEDIRQGFTTMRREGAEAVVILGDTAFVQRSQQIAELALSHRLPSIYLSREYPESGGLMSYGPEITDNLRRSATFVDRILKGAKPGELPFEQPTRYYLVLNLKTAKALGLGIPREVLLRADRVIE